MPANSVFYHFIDARRRTTDNCDDFRNWPALFGDTDPPLIDKLTDNAPYFTSLVELRQQVAANLSKKFCRASTIDNPVRELSLHPGAVDRIDLS
jgi:hypothetical protein